MAESLLEDLAARGFTAPTARRSLLAVWSVALVMGILTGLLTIDNPTSWIAFGLTLPALLLATSATNQFGDWLVLVLVTLIGVLSLFFDSTGDLAVLVYPGALSLTILATRGRLLIAGLGYVALVGMLVYSHLLTDGSAAQLLERVVITTCAIGMGFVARFHINRVAARELLARIELADAKALAEMAAELARRTVDDLDAVRQEALPMRRLLEEHGRIGSEKYQQLVVTEASIRDRIRVPRLHTPELCRAIRQARERYVRVHIIGEASDTRPPIPAGLGHAVEHAMADIHDGEVTIRIPPDRPSADAAVVLMLHIRNSETTTLHEYGNDGNLVRSR